MEKPWDKTSNLGTYYFIKIEDTEVCLQCLSSWAGLTVCYLLCLRESRGSGLNPRSPETLEPPKYLLRGRRCARSNCHMDDSVSTFWLFSRKNVGMDGLQDKHGSQPWAGVYGPGTCPGDFLDSTRWKAAHCLCHDYLVEPPSRGQLSKGHGAWPDARGKPKHPLYGSGENACLAKASQCRLPNVVHLFPWSSLAWEGSVRPQNWFLFRSPVG